MTTLLQQSSSFYPRPYPAHTSSPVVSLPVLSQNQRASTASTAPSPPAPSRPTSPEQAPLNSGRKSTAPLGFGGAGPVTDTVSAPKSARHGHTHRPQRGSHTDSGQRTSPHPLPPLSVKPHALDCREASDQIPLSPHDGMGVDGDGAFSRGEKRGRKRAVVFSLPGDRTGRNRTGGEARMDTMVGCEVTKAGTSGVAGGDEKSGDKDWGLREGWMRSFLLGAEQEREEGQAMEDGEVGGATKMWEDEGTQLDGDGARSELKEAMPNGRDRLQGRGQGGDKKESGERKDWEVARVAETGERTHTSVLYAPSPALPKRLSSHIPPSFVASSLERRSSNNQSRRSAFGARLSVLGGRRNAIQMEPTEQTMGDGPRSGEGDGNSAQRRKLSVRFGEASTRVLFRDADQRAPANPGTAWAEMEGGIGQSPLQGEAKGEAGPEVAGVEDCRSHSVSVSRGGHRGSPLSWARRPLRSTGGYRASDGAVVAWGAEGESRSMFGVSDVALRSPKSESIQGGAKALRGQPSGLLETAGGMEQGQLRMAVGVATQGLPEKQVRCLLNETIHEMRCLLNETVPEMRCVFCEAMPQCAP